MARRAHLSYQQKWGLWQLWRQGQTIAAIARALERFPSSVRDVVEPSGGIPPRALRSRSLRTLSMDERESISRGLAQGRSLRRIAGDLQRPPSTVSREVARHGGRVAYRADRADKRAWSNAGRPKPCLLAGNARLRLLVATKLRLQWSPEQIAAWLKLGFPGDQGMHVSHETIYRTLFIQARGVLKKELLAHLRTHRMMRRSKRAGTTVENRGKILDAVSVSERPAEAEDRAVPGHWEGDLLAGGNNSYVATLVERHSRFVMLVKVDGKHTSTVVEALAQRIRKLPLALRRSLTWDRGKELSRHREFTLATKVQVYFCDPHKPWQRGSNENTNGLLRQYFPKGMDLSGFSQAQLDKVALRLNQRPRETLKFAAPAETLRAAVAMTG